MDTQKRLLVFRILENSNRPHGVDSKLLLSGVKHFQHLTDRWRATCITRLLYANRIQQREQKPLLRARAFQQCANKLPAVMTTTYRQSREANRPNIGARCALPPRDRVLEVACEMFAEAGFHGTHFREMCKRAGTNVAGICYHFESKEGLYQAVLMEAGRRLSHRDKDLTGCCARLPSDQRLLKLTEWLLQKMSESHAWIGKLLARELLDPECGAHTYVASGLEKVCALLQYVMKDLLRANASPEAVRLHALHLMGECVFYSLAAENPNHPLTQLSAVPSSRTRLAQFLTERSLAALQTGPAALEVSNL